MSWANICMTAQDEHHARGIGWQLVAQLLFPDYAEMRAWRSGVVATAAILNRARPFTEAQEAKRASRYRATRSLLQHCHPRLGTIWELGTECALELNTLAVLGIA